MDKFVCGICGKSYNNLSDYVKCVSDCYENQQVKLEKEKQLKEINAYISEIKSKENILKKLANEIKQLKEGMHHKYPKEFELNFGTEDCCEIDTSDYLNKNKSSASNCNIKKKQETNKDDIETLLNLIGFKYPGLLDLF